MLSHFVPAQVTVMIVTPSLKDEKFAVACVVESLERVLIHTRFQPGDLKSVKEISNLPLPEPGKIA
jgi:hypothetical protein